MTTPKLTALFLAAFAITLHAQTAATIPYACDFENATENANWTLENGSQTNKWAIGTAAANAGSNGLYISNDNGTTNAYTVSGSNPSPTSYVYAYRSISFTAAGNHTISFNWRSYGEGNYDNLRAFLIPDNVTTLTAGNANGNIGSTNNIPSGWIAVSGVLNNQGSAWQSFSASVNVPSTGIYKLAFFWKNDNSSGTNPPAAVDNISVSPYSISATVLNSFGYLATPYTPAAQTVTITNNSVAGTITLTQPTSTNFDIGTLSVTSLAAGATATFTVQPKANLAVGIYSETITISGSNGASTTVSANFRVTNTYYITGTGTSFSASKVSAGGTPISDNATNKAIQTVIDAIKTDVGSSVPCTIQFGNGTDVLDIGTAYITFNSNPSAWGAITLTGKITSVGQSMSSYSTIQLYNGASISSMAVIAKTSNNGSAISNDGSSGVININGGMVSAIGRAIYNSDGAVTISGGEVSSTTGDAVYNSSNTGAVTISGGVVKATTGYAVNSTVATNITGGLVFAYGSAVTNVINGTYNTPSGGNPAIIAWDNTAGTAYTALSTTNISASPSPATTANWDMHNGIYYANDDNTGFIPLAVTVSKANGQASEPIPTIEISASNTSQHTRNLSTEIVLKEPDHGTSYALGAFADESEILTAKPTLGEDGHTLTFAGTGKESGTATLKVIVSSQNYTDIEATLTFEATPKEEVQITGITAPAQNYVYDGSPKLGYAGTATSGLYTDDLLYEYEGTGIEGITQTPPTDAGEYVLIVTVPDTAPYVADEVRIPFIIDQATPTAQAPTGITATFGQTLADIVSQLPTGWAWADATSTYVGTVGTQTHKAYFTPTDTRNYSTLQNVDVTVQVSEAPVNPSSSSVGEVPVETPSSSSVGEVPVVTPSSSSVGEAPVVTPSSSSAADDTPIFPNRENPKIGRIGVQTIGKTILLSNLPPNAKVEVYNLQGKRIYSSHSGNSQILKIQVQTGVYVVKAGTQTLRIAVK